MDAPPLLGPLLKFFFQVVIQCAIDGPLKKASSNLWPVSFEHALYLRLHMLKEMMSRHICSQSGS